MKPISARLNEDGLEVTLTYRYEDHEEAHDAGWHRKRSGRFTSDTPSSVFLLQCKRCKATCHECGTERYDETGAIEARVAAGMKCGRCAYS
jgi:hypothetical protein